LKAQWATYLVIEQSSLVYSLQQVTISLDLCTYGLDTNKTISSNGLHLIENYNSIFHIKKTSK